MPIKKYYIAVAILFAIYFVHGLIAIPKISITFDELDHFSYGVRVLQRHPEKVLPYDDASTMPVSALNALPRGVEQLFQPRLKRIDGGQHDVIAGRYISLLVCALIGWFILQCSASLYGRKAGLFSLFLFVFCPNINGHSILVTTDAFSALFTLTSAWYFRKMVLHASWENVCLFALHLGLAQLVKQSLSHLVIIYSILTIFFLFKGAFKDKGTIIALKALGAMAIVLLVINIGFLCWRTGMPLKDYHFTSTFFQGMQQQFSWIRSWPLPVPEPYLSGLDLTMHIDEIGPGRPESSDSAYILGHTRNGSGFWYYYLVVLLFKTPVPVIIATVLLSVKLWKDRKSIIFNEFIFLFIIGWLLVYFSFFYRSQVGVRHILMIYPLLYVLLGKIAGWVFQKRVTGFLLLIYSVATFYSYYPNLIAYTNEFIFPKRKAYTILADSNIDYGQSYLFLQGYLARHPEVHRADSIPLPGKQVIGINKYLDLDNTHRYHWLRDFTPIGQVAHSYLLFDIREEDIRALKSGQ